MTTTTTIRRALTLLAAAAAAVALAAPATAGERRDPGPGVAEDPKSLFLGRTSDGAALDYQLGSTPRSQSVTIAGERASVKVLRGQGARAYRAFVTRSGLKAGRSYTVTIRVRPRSGRTIMRTERLYLHRSLNRPRDGAR